MALNSLPVGTIIAWENATIPSGWQICNGTNGTPDLRDKFVRGSSQDDDVGTTGGSSGHSHTNPDTGSRAAHDHGGSDTASVGAGSGFSNVIVGSGAEGTDKNHTHGGSVTVSSENSHTHSVGDTGSDSTLPPHIKRVFIQRV